MRNKRQSVLALVLVLTLLFSGAGLAQTAWAESNDNPEELEITWRIKGSASREWSSEGVREEDGKVYARYDGNDSFSLTLAGTTALTNTGETTSGNPYLNQLMKTNIPAAVAGMAITLLGT